MHKARENSDGSFSIGKTWMLDDLSRIQTYEHMAPANPSEQQLKMWAANVGFVVTITKPYYWQAATQKERDFFIGSIVKIFKKYTGGKVPELVNFDPRERDLITGGLSSSPQPRQAASRDQPSAPAPAPAQRSRSPPRMTPPQPPFANQPSSRDRSKEPAKQPSHEHFQRAQRSYDEVPKSRPQFPSPKPSREVVNRDDHAPKSKESSVAAESPPVSLQAGQAPRRRPVGQTQLDEPKPKEIDIPPRPVPGAEDFAKPLISPAALNTSKTDISKRPPEISPSPKAKPQQRPSMADTKDSFELGSSHKSDTDDQFVTPLASPGPKPVEHPSLSAAGRSPKKPDPKIAQRPTPLEIPKDPENRTFPPVVSTPASVPAPLHLSSEDENGLKPEQPKSPSPPPTVTSPSPVKTSPDEEIHRPGLGPMVKKKDVASTFRKAANAYGAFKPRPGGAAERLMGAKEKNGDEPDGISGVVPAPLLRGQSSNEANKPTVSENVSKTIPPPTPTREEPPRVEVTPITGQQPSNEPVAQEITVAEPSTPVETATPKSPHFETEKPRQRREDHRGTYCNALGIDPSLIGDRGVQFDDILTDLGWDGKLNEERRIEDLEADIRREIGRVQASSWLGHLELQEGKVDQLSNLIDRTITECDELDGLLTLYSHELNVSRYLIFMLFSVANSCRHFPTMLHISSLSHKDYRFRLRIKNYYILSCRTFLPQDLFPQASG